MPELTTAQVAVPTELVEHLNRGDCVLFVGDGLDGEGAESARLVAALVDACGAHKVCPIPACRSGGKCSHDHACAIRLAYAAQLYMSHTNRQALVDFVLGHVDNESPPGPVHHALASLPVRVIITTAYDDRLEAALRQAGRRVLSVVRDEDIPFDDPGRVQLIRLHGTVREPGSLVLTEDDTADLFARLPTVTNILRGHFASKTLLFVGYRLEDPYFRQLYRQVTVPIARFKRLAYALQWPANELEAATWRGQIAFIQTESLPFLTELGRSTRAPTVEPEPVAVALPPEPYKFLDYYTREDAAIFFGRELEAGQLLSTILAHSLAILYGRSGTGKTSLLLARVVPALEEAGYGVAYARMLGDPSHEVKAAIRGAPADRLDPADRERRLCEVLVDGLPAEGRLVIVLDQFEEFFLRQGEAVRHAFAQELADCLRQGQTSKVSGEPAASHNFEGLDVHFVLSLRDDYLGALDELGTVLPQDVFAHRYRLENLTRDKALQAILKPAEAFGLPIEEALREQLIADLEDQGLEPANVQIVLYRLYRDAIEQGLWSAADKQGPGLTLARYGALGGTRDILAGYLDEVLNELPDLEKRQGARAILKSMVTAERTKAAVTGQEITHGDLVTRAGLTMAELDGLLDHLREKRVVRKFGDEDRFELAHEVMVEKVWAWVSEEELRLLDVRDMLRREMSTYGKFGYLLAREQLELVDTCREVLPLRTGEAELLFRSALAAGHDVGYWFGRAREEGVAVEGILKDGLESEQPNTRADAAAILGDLGLEETLPWLARALEDDYPHVRARAGASLQKVGTAQARQILDAYVPPDMIHIPAGKFVMGDDAGNYDEKPVHPVHLDAYYVGRHLVTNAEYARFLESTGQPPPRHWLEDQVPPGKENHPVVNVTWYEARDYAAWAGLRLLTEAEWEKAASWDQGKEKKRRYPWGDEFDQTRCNTNESGVGDTTPVGAYSPGGDSAYGCVDMAGNVREWTSSLEAQYPYQADDEHEDASSSRNRVLRGGSFYNYAGSARSACRFYFNPLSRSGYLGFRVGATAPFFAVHGR